MESNKTKTISLRVSLQEKIELLKEASEKKMSLTDLLLVKLNDAKEFEKIEPVLLKLLAAQKNTIEKSDQ